VLARAVLGPAFAPFWGLLVISVHIGASPSIRVVSPCPSDTCRRRPVNVRRRLAITWQFVGMSEPFTGPLNAMSRIFLEQWVTFPRFVLSGGWSHAMRAAP